MDNTIYIFRPYITVKGKRIYRKNGGMFKIPVGNKNYPRSKVVVFYRITEF